MRRLRNKFLKELSENSDLLEEVVTFYYTNEMIAASEHYECNKTSLWRFFKEHNIELNIVDVFKIGEQLIEIKGDQFLSEDLKWCCPYDYTLDKYYEVKHQCALQNKIKILYSKDYQKYIDWFYKQGYKKRRI